MATNKGQPRLGIALGGGSARGWAHIGVLRALELEGIRPEIVCGTSIGALVGGIYAAGRLPELEAWVGALTRRDVFSLTDFTMAGGGAIAGRKLMALYRRYVGDALIEELPLRYAAVATDLRTGAEVWLQEGALLEAIRASISLPGIFTPVYRDERWLVDGGLVNPVPVSVCRALGAEVVLAVDLHGGGGHQPQPEATAHRAVVRGRRWNLPALLTRERAGERSEAEEPMAPEPPGLGSIVTAALDIMQDRLSRSRLAGDPPDLLLSPRVRQVAPLEFAGGQPTIDEGYIVVRRMMPAIRDLLGLPARVQATPGGRGADAGSDLSADAAPPRSPAPPAAP